MLHDKGWPTQTSAYIISKAAMNAYARIVVKSYPSLLINWYLSWFCQNRYDFQHCSLYCRSGCQRPCYVGFPSKGRTFWLLFWKDGGINLLIISQLQEWVGFLLYVFPMVVFVRLSNFSYCFAETMVWWMWRFSCIQCYNYELYSSVCDNW